MARTYRDWAQWPSGVDWVLIRALEGFLDAQLSTRRVYWTRAEANLTDGDDEAMRLSDFPSYQPADLGSGSRALQRMIELGDLFVHIEVSKSDHIPSQVTYEGENQVEVLGLAEATRRWLARGDFSAVSGSAVSASQAPALVAPVGQPASPSPASTGDPTPTGSTPTASPSVAPPTPAAQPNLFSRAINNVWVVGSIVGLVIAILLALALWLNH